MTVVINPDEGRPKLVGSEWLKRDPEGDCWDLVVVRGIFDLGNDSPNNLELVISPKEFGPTITADVDSFVQAYKRAEEGADPFEQIDARLRALEARGS